uniref:Uncharacterized protein n=1 Tax=Magallana gigas TaxID=29159 RepID=K1RZ66_MAGGI
MAEWFKRCGLSRLGGEWAAEVQAPAGSKLNIQKKCMPGYTGLNCTTRCPYPTYGTRCQGYCNCSNYTCDVSTGCRTVTTDSVYEHFAIMDGVNSGGKGRRMCVAGGCSRRKSDGVSLHQFPFDRPAILRQWTAFVHNSQKLERSYQSSCALFCPFHGEFLPSQVSLNGVDGSSRPAERVGKRRCSNYTD